MSNIRPFQVILLASFGLLAIIALVFLSAFQSGKNAEERAYGESVVIWGVLPKDKVQETFYDIARVDKAFDVVEYRQFSESTFNSELVNAIAEGRSPDLVILKSDNLVNLRAKILPIPYSAISIRDFRDTYVDGAEIFTLAEGTYGIPFAVNPMVMYWNRDLFSSNALAQVPATWESVVAQIVPRLTVRDSAKNILQSAVSFGEYRNVTYAKNMLMLLTIQSGSKLVTQNGSEYKVNINQSVTEGGRAPLESVVQFYTDFSNVNSPLYSWNRSISSDTEAFLAGKLGLYFAPGTEYTDIARKNPNLNFDVAMVPQGSSATALRTYGDFYAFSIPKASKNAQGAYAVAKLLSSPQYVQGLTQSLGLAPARRDLITQGDDTLYRKVILESALIARAWLDPESEKSDGIFMQMIEDVVSNRARVSDAVSDAVNRLINVY